MQALKIWNEEKPPQLLEIELFEIENTFGVRMRFQANSVPLSTWESKEERLGRFFTKNMKAKVLSKDSGQIELTLTPSKEIKEISSQDR